MIMMDGRAVSREGGGSEETEATEATEATAAVNIAS